MDGPKGSTLIVATAVGSLVAASCMIDFTKYEPLPGAGGAGGGAPDSCGDGVHDSGEDCDERGETATCDADCTAVECGDGTWNRTAGEGCDDGNTSADDGCSASCEPQAFDLVTNVGSQEAEGAFIRPSVGLTTVEDEQRFVVVWNQHGSGATTRDVLMSLHTLDGTPQQDEPIALSTTSGNATCTSIASNQEGRAVVVWANETPPGSGSYETRWIVVEPGGVPNPSGDLVIPGSDGAAFDGCPEVGSTSTGEFCILWRRDDHLARVWCLDEAGNATGEPQSLGEESSGAAARLWGAHDIWGVQGGFVAAWYDRSTNELVGQKLEANGTPEGATFVLTDQQNRAYVGSGFGASTGDGFVTSFGLSGDFGETQSRTRFLCRRFSAPDAPLGAEVLVSSVHADEYTGRLIGHASGRFAALWASWSSAPAVGCNLQLLAFNPNGGPLGEPLAVVPGQPERCGLYAAGAASDGGDVMVVWTLWDTAGGSPYPPLRLQALAVPNLLADGG